MTNEEFNKSAKLVSEKFKAYCMNCRWSGVWYAEYYIAKEEGDMHEQDMRPEEHHTKIRRKTIHTN